MENIKAWAIINKSKTVLTDGGKLPIYWNRKVAEKKAEEFWGDKNMIRQVEIVYVFKKYRGKKFIV